ncbi:hydroxyethylthiazole kinase [Lactobacillus xylocopicola]|uniref:Hydroxyethylthiazole kinase n=1 Tax=Lactobacillus xylocopicola TaxID=2976676 RepID=A0ABN6SLJ7_9LACO|nr:hydroxyethylthiazole kinase [Lactobacillus xylocopicola]BDR61150.1 hydroxyethylthiazole kinase [Lactobacillus xylocopicola]
MQIDMLNKVRGQNPVVLNVANFVTVQDVANALNAIGASPIMSKEVAEAEEMVKMAGSVTINLGTLTKEQVIQMRTIGTLANQFHKPVVLDPVAVGAVHYRLETALDLLASFPVSIIRGNAGEIAALGGFDWRAHGIDAGTGSGNLDQITKQTATKFHCVVIASGATDTISDGKTVAHIYNGTSLFQAHVGSGDMLSSIVAAFAAVCDDPYAAAQAATLIFAATGEKLALDQPALGPGTFGSHLMDYLNKLQTTDFDQIARFD